MAPVNTQVDASREVTVELLANTAGGLPWKFEALDREVRMHPGEPVTVRYRVTNTLDRTVTPSPVNPMGVKGVGEAGTIASTPCIVNAVCDALSPLGVRHIDMPMTPEKVWKLIQGSGQRPGQRSGKEGGRA